MQLLLLRKGHDTPAGCQLHTCFVSKQAYSNVTHQLSHAGVFGGAAAVFELLDHLLLCGG
jgi:hypothetical protein